MVFGGAGKNLVFLFNWLTLKMCSLPNLPYDVGRLATTSGFGIPMFCGGNIPGQTLSRKTCYKFNLSTKAWTQVSSLLHISVKFFLVTFSIWTETNLAFGSNFGVALTLSKNTVLRQNLFLSNVSK